MEEGDANFVPIFDINGRKIKRYRTRINPLKYWTAEEFRRRYRVTKEIAEDLIFEFTGWYPKNLTEQGGAIPYAERVSRHFYTITSTLHH